uniref:RING-type domain-containing protein n=1 Tax=viral metagenome TaxID=1070528 RepID=A0A6C0IFH9_9ZZZZ
MTNIYTNYLNTMHDSFANSLEDNVEKLYVPFNELKVPLRRHQNAVIEQMNYYEDILLKGLNIKNSTLFSKYAILGDTVGVGKTLMVLGHICSLLNNNSQRNFLEFNKDSNKTCYSLERNNISDLSNAGCLIIVPHTLFRQWSDEIKTKTNLKCLLLKTKKNVEDPEFLKNIIENDLILVSNTLFKEVYIKTTENKIRWKRIYIDEADTIEITSTWIRGIANEYTNFIWFISASYINLLFHNSYSIYLSTIVVNQFLQKDNLDSEFRTFVEKNMKHYVNTLRLQVSVRSTRFLNEIINGSHPLRGHLVIRCKKSFIDQSIQLPQLFSQIILCKPSISHQIVYDIITGNVRQLLNAGDLKSALDTLGVKTENNIVQAVTEQKVKELERLEKTYEFKQGLEYSSESVKESSLKNLQDKINQVKEQIKSLKERVENYKEEICPICYDEPNDALITNCCSRVFCAMCVLQSLSRNPTCPLCRAEMLPSSLKKIGIENEIVINEEVNPNEPKKKIESLFEILEQNPSGKFLVYSRYDNSFLEVLEGCKQKKIVAKELKGSKDMIASMLGNFKEGKVNCLLMNTLQMGAGLNITEATHVILLHAMNHEEEKQILGRAYRVGRTNELHFIKLLYPDEN